MRKLHETEGTHALQGALVSMSVCPSDSYAEILTSKKMVLDGEILDGGKGRRERRIRRGCLTDTKLQLDGRNMF